MDGPNCTKIASGKLSGYPDLELNYPDFINNELSGYYPDWILSGFHHYTK